MSRNARISRLRGLTESPHQTFEDTSFVTGDSPVTLNCNAALGRNALSGYIINDGVGNFTIATTSDGTNYGDEATVEKNETYEFDNMSVHSIRITWIENSSYRIAVV
jgi:hypothetical protein